MSYKFIITVPNDLQIYEMNFIDNVSKKRCSKLKRGRISRERQLTDDGVGGVADEHVGVLHGLVHGGQAGAEAAAQAEQRQDGGLDGVTHELVHFAAHGVSLEGRGQIS